MLTLNYYNFLDDHSEGNEEWLKLLHTVLCRFLESFLLFEPFHFPATNEST